MTNTPHNQWARPGCQRADFIEVCLSDIETAGLKTNVLRKGHLVDAEIAGWLGQTPQFSTTAGGLRLLVLDRHGYDVQLPLTKDMFAKVVDVFNLSHDTLDIFHSHAGAISKRCRFDSKGDLSGINSVLKAPQSYSIQNSAPNVRTTGNWGLSLHYDLVSGITTGILYGTNVIVCADEADVPGRHADEINGHPDFGSETLDGLGDGLEKDPRVNESLPSLLPTGWKLRRWPELAPAMEAKKCDLRHPFALPILLLGLHAWGIRSVVEDGFITKQSLSIQRDILFDKPKHRHSLHSGSGYGESQHTPNQQASGRFWKRTLGVDKLYTHKGEELRDEARDMTVTLSLQAIRLSHGLRPLEWNVDCCSFLLQVVRDLRQSLQGPPRSTAKDSSHRGTSISSQSVPDTDRAAMLGQTLEDDLQLIISISTGVVRHIKSAQENLNIHFELANTLISQLSNEFGVQIAIDNFRDSTSMQVLAIITTLFLPGTFVATFMGVGIWNWRWLPNDPDHGEPGLVSSRWWVYVVVTAPLTIGTLMTWIFWWDTQISRREGRHPVKALWKSMPFEQKKQLKQAQDEMP